jgi:hypothetical protein
VRRNADRLHQKQQTAELDAKIGIVSQNGQRKRSSSVLTGGGSRPVSSDCKGLIDGMARFAG